MKKIILIMCSLLFVACSGVQMRDTDIKDKIQGKKYVLDGTIGESEITILFSDGKISGTSGVNRYFSSYTIDKNNLSIGLIGTTRMMGPEDLMKQEMKYIKTLQKSKSVSLEGTKLVIVTTEGKKLSFSPKIEDVEGILESKTYTLSDNNKEFPITIEFKGGRIFGKSGINNYSTSYEISESNITISPQIIMTAMAGPEEEMKRESKFLKELTMVKKVKFQEEKLLLILSDRNQLIFK